MSHDVSPPAARGAVLSEVLLVDKIERVEPGEFVSESLPGHLVHIVTRGEVKQRAGGVTQCFGAGQAIWYFENEPVRGTVLKAPWAFYTANFIAPWLSPPPLNQRVQPVEPKTVANMERLLQLWQAADMPAMSRHLRIHAMLLEVIADLIPADVQHHHVGRHARAWWEIEAQLRKDLGQPIDLKFIERLSRRSQRSIVRACQLAVGLSPMKRVKQIRLSYARGLVQLSDMSMTEIALRVGYSRVQEFSRDYRACYGCTPSMDRRSALHYRNREEPS